MNTFLTFHALRPGVGKRYTAPQKYPFYPNTGMENTRKALAKVFWRVS
jgi:hypothetical protein